MAGISPAIGEQELAARFELPGASVAVHQPEPRLLAQEPIERGFAFVDVKGVADNAVAKLAQVVCPSTPRAASLRHTCVQRDAWASCLYSKPGHYGSMSASVGGMLRVHLCGKHNAGCARGCMSHMLIGALHNVSDVYLPCI